MTDNRDFGTPSPSASTTAVLRELGGRLSRIWWIPLIAGVVSFGLGLAFLATDWTLKALVVVSGLLFVFRGLALIFSPEESTATNGAHVLGGILGVVAGVVLIAWPGPTLLVLAFFVGAWLATIGGFRIVVAIAHRHDMTHWITVLAIGVVELALGVWAMRRPEVTLNLVTAILGVWAVLTGVILAVQAFEIRRDAKMLQTAAGARYVSGRSSRLERLRAQGLLTDAEFAQLTAGAEAPERRAG